MCIMQTVMTFAYYTTHIKSTEDSNSAFSHREGVALNNFHEAEFQKVARLKSSKLSFSCRLATRTELISSLHITAHEVFLSAGKLQTRLYLPSTHPLSKPRYKKIPIGLYIFWRKKQAANHLQEDKWTFTKIFPLN